MTGTVVTRNRNFAFVETVSPEGETVRVFVHQNDCDFRLNEVLFGDVLVFDVYQAEKGPTASFVRFLERPEPSGPYVVGRVSSLNPMRGVAFMQPDDGSEPIYLHISNFVDVTNRSSAMFRALATGTRVGCYKQPHTPDQKHPRGLRIHVIEE